MNNSSWFLYTVDVMGDIEALLVFCLLAVLGWYGVLKGILSGDGPDEYYRNRENFNQMPAKILILCLLIVAMPSTKTMYLIMGSEVGEHVVMSETGQRVQDAINKKLDEYLGET